MSAHKKKPLGSGAASQRSYVSSGERAIDRLLSRLENVRRQGEGYRADCPNGHSRAKGSLSIADASDRVLMNCFACRDTLGILHAIGLSLSDLFDRRLPDNDSPQQRRERQRQFRRSAWSSALQVAAYEAHVILIAAEWVAAGKRLAPDDLKSLHRATFLLQECRGVMCG